MPPKKRFRPGSLAPLPSAKPKGTAALPANFTLPYTPANTGSLGFKVLPQTGHDRATPSAHAARQAPVVGCSNPWVASQEHPNGPDLRGGFRLRDDDTHGPVCSSFRVGPGRMSHTQPSAPRSRLTDTIQAIDSDRSSNACARPRWDAPVVAHSKRGNRDAALSAARDNRSKDEAMRSLVEDIQSFWLKPSCLHGDTGTRGAAVCAS